MLWPLDHSLIGQGRPQSLVVLDQAVEFFDRQVAIP
jgi:hypothetical protein